MTSGSLGDLRHGRGLVGIDKRHDRSTFTRLLADSGDTAIRPDPLFGRARLGSSSRSGRLHGVGSSDTGSRSGGGRLDDVGSCDWSAENGSVTRRLDGSGTSRSDGTSPRARSLSRRLVSTLSTGHGALTVGSLTHRPAGRLGWNETASNRHRASFGIVSAYSID